MNSGSAGLQLLLAEEARQQIDPELASDGGPSPERPPDDWEISKVLLLAQVQLDQLVTLVSRFTGIPEPLADVADTRAAIEWVARALRDADGGPAEVHGKVEGVRAPDDFEWLADMVGEAVELRQALSGGPHLVGHAFAIDGSITFTLGPETPACPALGLRGSPGREMEDRPAEVFHAAVRATECAACLEYWARELGIVWLGRSAPEAGPGSSPDVPAEQESDPDVPQTLDEHRYAGLVGLDIFTRDGYEMARALGLW
ncbi:MAG: hypothetical protein U0R64_01915 [Candidatus Nanopelagicales bacterium]